MDSYWRQNILLWQQSVLSVPRISAPPPLSQRLWEQQQQRLGTWVRSEVNRVIWMNLMKSLNWSLVRGCKYWASNGDGKPQPYLISIIFITMLVHFFSMQSCIYRDKTDYAKNSVNCHRTDFRTKNRVNFRFLHICHVENFEIPPNLATFLISPHLLCEKAEIPLHL